MEDPGALEMKKRRRKTDPGIPDFLAFSWDIYVG